MTKQLELGIKIERAKRELAEQMAKRDALNAKKDALKVRGEKLSEMTDEDIAAYEAELAAVEAEEREDQSEGKIAEIEAGMSAMEEELRSIGEGKPEPEKREKKERDQMNFETMSIRERLLREAETEEGKAFIASVRALRAVNGSSVIVPSVSVGTLHKVVEEKSKLYKYVNHKSVKGTARQRIVGDAPEAVWTEMTGKLNELGITFNQIEVDGYKVGGFIPVSNSLLEDNDANLYAEIITMLGQSIGYALDKAILFGTGTKMPLGIATRLAAKTAPRSLGANAPAYTDLSATHIGKLTSASATEVKQYQELVKVLGTAKSKYGVGGKFWAMNETTWANLQAMLLTINAAGAVVTGASTKLPIIGGDVVLLDFVPDNAIVGGFGGLYLLAERAGTQIAKSEHAQFVEDNTVFKGTARYDGVPSVGEGFAMFTLATTAAATTVTFPTDTANAG